MSTRAAISTQIRDAATLAPGEPLRFGFGVIAWISAVGHAGPDEAKQLKT